MKRTGISIYIIPVFRHQITLVFRIHICNDIKGIKLCGGGTANCPGGLVFTVAAFTFQPSYEI